MGQVKVIKMRIWKSQDKSYKIHLGLCKNSSTKPDSANHDHVLLMKDHSHPQAPSLLVLHKLRTVPFNCLLSKII